MKNNHPDFQQISQIANYNNNNNNNNTLNKNSLNSFTDKIPSNSSNSNFNQAGNQGNNTFNNNTNISNFNKTKNSITKETKYNEVREKLDKLNFKLHFDINNLQLIDLLTNELIASKNQIETLKQNSQNLKESVDRSLLNVSAFKKENIKLIKENNELIKQNIELGKNLNNSNNGKSLEIKRLQDEKNDFKFMLSNSKIKIENLNKENSLLRTKLNGLLSKIYDTNFNENNLKTLFDKENNNNSNVNLQEINNNNNRTENEGFNANANNNLNSNNGLKEISDIKMGIYVKQRNIQLTNNLDLGNNSLNRINDNKDYLDKLLINTFGKRRIDNNNNNNEDEDLNNSKENLNKIN